MTSATASAGTLQDLKQRHKALYDRAFAECSELVEDKGKMKGFLKEVDDFLKDLTQLSGEVESIEDFDWISDTALRWPLTLSTVLNEPHGTVMLSSSPLLESPKTPQFYTEPALKERLDRAARDRYLDRWKSLLQDPGALGKLLRSTPKQQDQDWRDAEIIFASEVLDGGFHLTRQLGSESYHRLEGLWLDEVKRAKAYFIWKNRPEEPASPSRHEQDYLDASSQLRSQLVREDLKAPGLAFEEVREYLTSRYLTDGTLDAEKPGTAKLIESKADRIREITGEPDAAENRSNADTYCRAFYESIVPAVLDEEPKSKQEHTLQALKALELSQASKHRHLIINSFEAALAIYFLDAGIVEGLWSERALPRTSPL